MSRILLACRRPIGPLMQYNLPVSDDLLHSTGWDAFSQ